MHEQSPEARLALEDERAGVGPLALENVRPGGGSAGEVALVPVVVMPTFARQPVARALADGRVARIHFDRGTHVSKRPRALTECRVHTRCRCGRFISDFESEDQCIAWMLAWHDAAAGIVGAEKALEHRHCVVPAEVVADWLNRLRSK